jgi:hypothetical protein
VWWSGWWVERNNVLMHRLTATHIFLNVLYSTPT